MMPVPTRVALFEIRAAMALGRTLGEFKRLPMATRMAACAAEERDHYMARPGFLSALFTFGKALFNG